MEKYSKAVSGMYPQFKRKEARPMEKYTGRHVRYGGKILEAVGYRRDKSSFGMPIVDASQREGRMAVGFHDVIFKKCKMYWHVGINDLMD